MRNARELDDFTTTDESLLQKGNVVEEVEKSKWTTRLTIAGLAAALGTAVPTGYCISVLNSPAVHMRNWCNETLIKHYNLRLKPGSMDILWSAIVSIFLLGGGIGALSGAWIANKFGRKNSIFGCQALFIIAGICFYACRLMGSVELLLLGRLIVGLASGITTPCLPMYLSEIAPLRLRGSLGVFLGLGSTIGKVIGQIISLSNVFGSESNWHFAISFYVVFVLISILPYTYYPESPKWLYIIKKDAKEAEMELFKLRSVNETRLIVQELEIMKREAQEPNQSSNFREVLTDSKLLLPLILVCAYNAGQQLSGINAIYYYSVSIFREAGLTTVAAEWVNVSAGAFNLLVSLVTPYLMAKYNRRALMLYSSFCCFFAMLAFSVMLSFIQIVSWFTIAGIVCMLLYILFFQCGIGPIAFFIGSELFEVAPRSVAMSIGSLSNFMGNFIIGMTFPSLQNVWGALVFLPCAITCAVLFFLTLVYLPETRGRNPTEVAALVSKGFKSKVR